MRIRIITLALCASLLSLSACEDFLDKQPDELLTIDVTFANRQYTENFLYGIYSQMPSHNFWSEQPYNGISDEVDITWNRSNSPTYAMNLGNWDASYGLVSDVWRRYYRSFRQIAIFLANVDKAPIPADTKKQYKAEAKLLRGYYYSILVQSYGAVPLVKELVSFDTPTFDIPRNSFDECIASIVTDLDEAAIDLPVKHENIWAGKPTKGAALAIKARIMMWAASPLMNGNPELTTVKNKDGKALFPQTYDANRWKLAADACKAVVDLGVYKLHVISDSKGVVDPVASYKGIFISQYGNQEIIWARNLDGGASLELDRHCMLRSKGGWNGVGVTQKSVDEYEMANGKSIKDPTSGYLETGFSAVDTKYSPKGTWNMYVGREPRFYVSVNYSGASWWDNSKSEFFYKGKDGKEIGRDDHSRTGYLVRKYIDPISDPVANRNRAKLFPLIRLADIYLMLAEATNEFTGPTAEAVGYVNSVRERAGLPALMTGASKDEFRSRIIHERAIELAYEQVRYFDLRRWKLGPEMGGAFTGMAVDLGATATDEKYFTRTNFETRVFTQKHYLWPIPQPEVDKNSAMVQNPGW